MTWITDRADGVCLTIKVAPRASRDDIVGIQGDMLKVQLTAPPLEGKANAALVKFLSARLGISRSQIRIVHGATARCKFVHISGLSQAQVCARLLPPE